MAADFFGEAGRYSCFARAVLAPDLAIAFASSFLLVTWDFFLSVPPVDAAGFEVADFALI